MTAESAPVPVMPGALIRLQWSRGRMTAESPRTKRCCVATACFNGAAVG